MPETLTPFAVGIDAQRENVEILSGRNSSRLVVPVGDWALLTAVLREFDPRSSHEQTHGNPSRPADNRSEWDAILSRRVESAICEERRIRALTARTEARLSDRVLTRLLHALRSVGPKRLRIRLRSGRGAGGACRGWINPEAERAASIARMQAGSMPLPVRPTSWLRRLREFGLRRMGCR